MDRYCDKHETPLPDGKRCTQCASEYQREYRKRRPPRKPTALENRRRADKHRYGLTYEQSDALRSIKVCQVCGNPPGKKPLVIDHDHETGEVRGVLCQHCNLSIGHAFDDPERLRALANYLEENR